MPSSLSLTSLSQEILDLVVSLAIDGASLFQPTVAAHHPVAYTCSLVRATYLNLHSRADFGYGKRRLPWGSIPRPLNTNPIICEAIHFPNLYALACFLRDGQTMSNDALVRRISYIRIDYQDPVSPSHDPDFFYERWHTQYAYEAFELLAANYHRFQLQRLQIHITTADIPSIDTAGIWNLLKLRGVSHVFFSGRYRHVPSRLRQVIQQRLSWRLDRPWKLTGLESPSRLDWIAKAEARGTGAPAERQYQWLESYYRERFDRVTVKQRRKKQMKARDRARGGVSRMSLLARRRRRELQHLRRDYSLSL